MSTRGEGKEGGKERKVKVDSESLKILGQKMELEGRRKRQVRRGKCWRWGIDID